jgi:hypothetical protein
VIERYSELKHAFDGVMGNVFTERTELSEKGKYDDELDELAVPEVMPCMFDVTVEAWIMRLEFWGKLIISWKDPDRWMKQKITKSKLLELLTDDTMLNIFGRWQAEKLTVKSVKLYRRYIGLDGKKKHEEIVIDIDLDDDLKRSMKGKY